MGRERGRRGGDTREGQEGGGRLPLLPLTTHTTHTDILRSGMTTLDEGAGGWVGGAVTMARMARIRKKVAKKCSLL